MTRDDVPVATPTTPALRRRLADRILADGITLAQAWAEQDRLDPARPTLGQLIAEALAAAERRGRNAALQDLAAWADAQIPPWGSAEEFAGWRDCAEEARRRIDAADPL
jgi:hypothetical protein